MLPPPGTRGGSGNVASVASVSASIRYSRGPSTPTHTVTIRPRESNVTDAQSALRNVSTRDICVAERARALVHVGLVGVDVQVRARVGRHERVPRRVGRLDGPLRARARR